MDDMELMEGLKDRLRAIRATQAELAAHMGVDIKAVSRIANPHSEGGRKSLSRAEVSRIESFFERRERPAYTIGGDDSPRRRSELAQPSGLGTIPLFTGIDVPGGHVLSLSTPAQYGRVLAHPAQVTAREAFAVTIVDDTMSPRFESGEYAYVVPGLQPRKGQDCLVESDDLTARVLQFVERNEKQVIFKQLNPPAQVVRRNTEVKVHAIVGRG